jgi:hypothetical protein
MTDEKPPPKWKADILRDLPQARIQVKAHTFPNAYDLIKVAAYNRRMSVEEFIGRAALAVAVADTKGEVTWKQMTRLEPPMKDLRRHNLPRRRLFGRGFGPWEIEKMK